MLTISLKMTKIIHCLSRSLQQILKQISAHPKLFIYAPWALIGMNTVYTYSALCTSLLVAVANERAFEWHIFLRLSPV